ncbi:MAG: hypothetical protein WD599_00920, partial [Balneolaceae bacterium]
PGLDNEAVTQLRPAKNRMDPSRPYFWLREQEPGRDGFLREVHTLFLTNTECPFKCVMCDLWKDTLNQPTPPGAIPQQIRLAQSHLSGASIIKLYNNGNFFDRKAIPPEDHPEICSLLSSYSHVIVENHPKLCNPSIPEFRERLRGTLEIAMGLETVHPKVLPALNKQMTTDLFARATEYLLQNDISVRAFILLNPPFLTDQGENIEWCLKSVEFAFDHGVECCSIIPTRTGNGAMEKLQQEGNYVPPTLNALERVYEEALRMDRGRVFADLWDLDKFSDCDNCLKERTSRLKKMNLEQRILPRVTCHCT